MKQQDFIRKYEYNEYIHGQKLEMTMNSENNAKFHDGFFGVMLKKA